MAINIGTQLGVYEITALLGKGGMGEVYRARDSKLKREVAIKILPEEFSRDEDRVNRFQREAEVLASLNHTNIAAIHDLQEASGLRFLILELVEGETLADRIARGPIPIDDAVAIAKQITEGLEAAHEKGIIHRDLKPANIKILPDGKVKLLDFGLAKAFAGGSNDALLSNSPTVMSGSLPGMIMGTAAYMSPEQARGKPVDRRTDVWAFGCVLFEMLTGQLAFHGEDMIQVLSAVVRAEPDWNAIPSELSAPLRSVLRRCLQKDPKRRLHDVGDVWIEVDDLTDAQPLLTAQLAPSSRRIWQVTTAIFAIAAAGLVSHTSGLFPNQQRLSTFQFRNRPAHRYQFLQTGNTSLSLPAS
jgi:eukaryotic-like serine/threonine-protein kinase